MTHENEFEYYTVFPQITAGVPTVIVNPDSDLEVDLDLEIPYPLENIDLIEFEFDEPYPKKPSMVDMHSRSGDCVVSEKLYRAFDSLKINSIQLIPSTIFDPKNKKMYDKYWFLHIHNYIECLDLEKSDYTRDVLDMIDRINKMVLDTAVLSKIPLEDRLVFRLGELFTCQLFHKSVVEKIMAASPTGIRFVKVEDFHSGSAFD